MKKITMLGVSNSGKTCFIYAMYDFMQRVQNGFTFLANDPDVDLELGDGWDTIANDGTWPNGTGATSSYDFTVMFNSRSVMNFSWYDYRGSALTSKSNDNPDVKDLLDRINDSECLIICIGADTVKDYLNENSGNRVFKRLNQFIQRYALNNQRRIPIIFALTKADLYTKEDQPKLLKTIRDNFGILFQQGNKWMVAVVPVTLGVFKTSCDRNQPIQGTVAPKNIHIPVMFFMHCLLKEQIQNIQNKLHGISFQKYKYGQEIKNNQGRSWWDKMWNGDNTSTLNANISNLSEEERNLTSQLTELETVFSSMKDMFRVCKIFFDGQELSI